MAQLRYIYPFKYKHVGLETGLTKFEFIAARALLGMVSDCDCRDWVVKDRADLAIQAATETVALLSDITGRRQWDLLPVFPIRQDGGRRGRSFCGLTALEYVTGKMLTGSLRQFTPLCPSLVTKAVHVAVRYGRAIADTLTVGVGEPVFSCCDYAGLCQRDRAETSVVAEMLPTADGAEPYKLALSASRTVQPMGYLPPWGQKRDLTKKDFFIERMVPALVNHDCRHYFSRFADQWKKSSDSACAELTIAEWSTTNIAAVLLADIHPEDEIPENLVAIAFERYNHLHQVLTDPWEFRIDPSNSIYPSSESETVVIDNRGIDSYSWLSSLILSELGRTYGADVASQDLLADMARYSVLQSDVFWEKCATAQRESVESPIA